MMIRRAKTKAYEFVKKADATIDILLEKQQQTRRLLGKYLKTKRCISIYLYSNREYIYRIDGRCISFRSRGKISSILVRNITYGVEQRILINNPRIVVYI